MNDPISAYDLAREIVRRLEGRGDWFFIDHDVFEEGDPGEVVIVEQEAILIMERVIREALQNGRGIKP